MEDGVIKFDTWAHYSREMDSIASKSAILDLALDDSGIYTAELLFKVADVFKEINDSIQKLKDEFNDLPTIYT
ncbi:MAG: hypothetical protein AB7S65_08175 [Sulfuricurvum sp.]